MANVAFFDMNETTLDLDPLDFLFDAWFPNKGVRRAWFQRLLHTTMMTIIVGPRKPFGELAGTSLAAVADAHAVSLPKNAMKDIAATLARLPLHDDVVDGLQELTEAGWRLIALTNSDQAMVEGQLANVGADHFFEQIISVENLNTFKPVAEVYQHAAAQAGIEPSEGWMVACHDWDLEAAKNVGMKTAYVHRYLTSFSSAFTPPDIQVNDFRELASVLGDG